MSAPVTDAPLRLLVLAPDASATPPTAALVALLDQLGAADGPGAEVVLWAGGERLGDLRARARVGVVTDLAPRSAGAVVEKALLRLGPKPAGHAVRRRRLGVSPWGRRPPGAVLVTDPAAAPLLRHLPDPSGAPIWVVVPAGELTDARPAQLSDADLSLLLSRADRFLVEADDSWSHLVDTLGVDPARLVAVGVPSLDGPPEPPTAERLAGWRERLGLGAERPVVVGSGPLVWDGGTDLFVRMTWILRARLGRDVAVVWVGAPGEALELTQLRHDIDHMGLADDVHLLLGPDDGEALWLGDVHVVTSRRPETVGLHVPAASRGQALVGWEADALARFTGDDAGRLVPFLDLAGLAGVVAGLLDDPAAREALGRRGLERFRDWHVRPDHAAAVLRRLRAGP